MPRELLVLALSAGLSSADLAATVDKLRESSKSVGAHKRRQLFWDAYSQMSKAAASVADGAWVFLKYTADASQENPEGEVEVLELTKRQRGLVSGGGVDVMGPKFKPPATGLIHPLRYPESRGLKPFQNRFSSVSS